MYLLADSWVPRGPLTPGLPPHITAVVRDRELTLTFADSLNSQALRGLGHYFAFRSTLSLAVLLVHVRAINILKNGVLCAPPRNQETLR